MGVEVCPVHKVEFECSSLHVDAMSTADPRGLKRKREEDDALASDVTWASAQRRLTLLDITYDKIKRTQAERNPTLERQVLLTNVVRQLRDSFEKDGIRVSGLTRDSSEPVWAHHVNQVSDLDPPPSTSCDLLQLPSDPSILMETEDRPPTPFVLRPPQSSDCWSNEEDSRLHSLNWSNVLKSSGTACPSPMACCEGETSEDVSLHVLMPAQQADADSSYGGSSSGCLASLASAPTSDASDNATSSSSYSTHPSPSSSSEDEIFADVDLTLYDYDYGPLSPPPAPPIPTPLTAEELLWSLAHDNAPTRLPT